MGWLQRWPAGGVLKSRKAWMPLLEHSWRGHVGSGGLFRAQFPGRQTSRWRSAGRSCIWRCSWDWRLERGVGKQRKPRETFGCGGCTYHKASAGPLGWPFSMARANLSLVTGLSRWWFPELLGGLSSVRRRLLGGWSGISLQGARRGDLQLRDQRKCSQKCGNGILMQRWSTEELLNRLQST